MKKGYKIRIVIGAGLFVIGLILSSGLLIAFGAGMALSNLLFNERAASKSLVPAKKQMTAEENNQLISVILPVIANGGK